MQHRISKLLVVIGALCFLAAGVSIGFTLAVPTGASAAAARSIGTPTPPPAPTDEPTTEPTAPPTTVPPTAVPPTATPPAATTAPVQPTATNMPQRHRPGPTSTPAPTNTPEPTATTEPWITDVELVKQASQTEALPGDTFTYTLVARNIGAKTAFDVIVRDAVPQQFEVADLGSTKGNISVKGQTVTAYPQTLEAGESTTYRITVRVRADAKPGQISNTGRITTSTGGDLPGNNTSTVVVAIHAPQPKIHVPLRMPITGEPSQVSALDALATVAPTTWVGMFGGLLLLFGGVLSWGLRGWLRRAPAATSSGTDRIAPDGALASAYRLPPPAPAGPPRLGPALPDAQPPAPLPPIVPIDRADALRDALRSSLE